ncbi:MAG: hypothetical protein PHW64_03065 [Sulfuricurvum sp.]|nr:hypothetical protein [Sulfuricurvum sp.]
MDTPELITIQKYASQHRISIHSVIKKIMKGELPSVVQEENGKEVTYIALSQAVSIPSARAESSKDDEALIDYKKAYDSLHREYLILKTKYEKLLEIHGEG